MLIRSKESDLILALAPAMELKDFKYDVAIKFIRIFLGEENIFQKKAYKLLDIVVDKVHESFLGNMLDILNDYKVVTAGARGPRIQCLEKILEKIEFSSAKINDVFLVLQKFLPEIMICLKETNKKARKASTDLMKMVTLKMKNSGFLKQFINLVVGGFASKTSLMKSASVIGITNILKEIKMEFEVEFLWEVTTLILLLIKEQNREVFKSILGFFKVLFKVLSVDQVTSKLDQILKAIFEWDDESRELFKSKIRHLIEKLIRRLGKPVVEAALPLDHRKLLKYIAKQEKQSKKKKEDKRVEKKKNKVFLEDLLSDDERNKKEVPEPREYIDPNRMEVVENENNLLLRFDTNKEKFHFEEHPIAKIKEKLKKEVEIENDVLFNDETGKITIKDDNKYVGKKRKRENKYEDMETILNEDKMQVEKQDGQPEAPVSRVKKMIKLNNAKAVVAKEHHGVSKPEEKKGIQHNPNVISEVKMYNNAPDPYAFIQVTPKVLNKRAKHNASKAFEFLISKKKSGALKGMKTKVKTQ
jgi:ribosomal RNA-processing protein 12